MQDVLKRVEDLLMMERISGVIDDRGEPFVVPRALTTARRPSLATASHYVDGSCCFPRACATFTNPRILPCCSECVLNWCLLAAGKFICITKKEMDEVAKFMRRRGRVNVADLAAESNKLIDLTPKDLPDKGKQNDSAAPENEST